MKFNLKMAISIIWIIIVFCILIGITVLMIAQMSPQNICQSLCNYHNGTYWMVSDCEGNNIMACAGFCNYNNKSVACNNLLDEINSSV